MIEWGTIENRNAAGYDSDDPIRFTAEFGAYYLRVNELTSTKWTWVILRENETVAESDTESPTAEGAMIEAETALASLARQAVVKSLQ